VDRPLGGTELQRDWLLENLPSEILDRVQLMCRPEELDPNKVKVLWVHDMPLDVPFLANANTRACFAKIVFVSGWQQTVFNINAKVPYSDGVVIKNAVYPIPRAEKSKDVIRLVYHPTPHRGLQILVPVFERLAEKYDNIRLDVFSNFDIYARGHLNAQFEPLYERCRQHERITYHGSQPNDVVRDALSKSHIFAYPCIWRETSCMAAMEAMTARCLVVAPDYGALSETLANFNLSYNWTENQLEHEKIFEKKLSDAIEMIQERQESTENLLNAQKEYADCFYNRDTRINQWIDFLSTTENRNNS
jgi:UDP-glucose:(glucosyl)LPS alpha-1,2-glucosyltransferase